MKRIEIVRTEEEAYVWYKQVDKLYSFQHVSITMDDLIEVARTGILCIVANDEYAITIRVGNKREYLYEE